MFAISVEGQLGETPYSMETFEDENNEKEAKDVEHDSDEKELDKLAMEDQVGLIHQDVVLNEDQAGIRLFQERIPQLP